jgi:flavin-dependent dehydrogenase
MRDEFDVIVIGGGPAGSTAAGLLAKWGRRVILLEKETFPRYHIGESLVPGMIPILAELGATEAVEAAGAVKKYGISALWGASSEAWSVRFDEISPYPYSYQVKRAEFDSLLLGQARRLGALALEEATVRDLLFDGDRCVGVRYSRGRASETAEVHAPVVIDTSGQAKIGARHLNTVGWHDDLKNLAAWTYYQGGIRYDGQDAGNIVIENRPPGWLWLIPFNDGTCSVGYVAPGVEFAATGLTPAEVLYQRITESKEIKRLLAGAVEVSVVRTAKDWSYTTGRMTGPGFAMAGDAAAFIDPLFSTGVMLAMKSAHAVAGTVHRILDEPENEAVLLKGYEESYRDFLDVVLSFVRFFYNPSREVVEYFVRARELVDPLERLQAREDFILLISGLYGARSVIEPSGTRATTSAFQSPIPRKTAPDGG